MNILTENLKKIGINITEHELFQFDTYMEYLLEYNKHTNLTAITQPEQVLIKHFFDSVLITKFFKIKPEDKIIDVGTGAGFPGVPIKIIYKDISLTLVDSSNKKVDFLKKLVDKLNINAEIFHGRAEELSFQKEFREKFDFAVSRAVAPLNILAEYCLPYVKLEGFFVALKGPNVQDEILKSENAIEVLGGKLFKTETFELPCNYGTRNVIVIQKTKNTPDIYPRTNAKIKSAPL